MTLRIPRVVVLVAAATLAASGSTSAQADKVDDDILGELQKQKIPGLSIGEPERSVFISVGRVTR